MVRPTPPAGKVRRPGYAPDANPGVGRRGLHTRERILARAAEVFLANGFHGTSLDAIAKAANASRATVYQYFAGKEEIFGELSAAAERDVLDHGARLGALGPTIPGIHALHCWLGDWADVYDSHAAVFAEFPGIGTAAGLSVIDAGAVAENFRRAVTDRVRGAPLRGLDPDDAAAALMRIPHMVHLYRHRAMFALPARGVVAASLTAAMQLMLFPDTPADVLSTVAAPHAGQPAGPRPALAEQADCLPRLAEDPLPPIGRDVLSVSSALFAEHGYYAVSMEQIADAADISRATLYRHFSTKDTILAELTRRAVAEIEQQAAALPRTADAGSLAEWTLRYVRFHRGCRGVIRAWFDGTVAAQLSDAEVVHGIGAIHHAVGELLDVVTLPAAIDREVAVAVFLAVLGRMTEPTARHPDTDERAAQLVAELLRRSLLPSA
jgi:AcrR family transcriptional regulator